MREREKEIKRGSEREEERECVRKSASLTLTGIYFGCFLALFTPKSVIKCAVNG